ncbi:MAG: chorismate synthase [Bdellovibrionaceae bacterium]|nr:chorismate synthase [Pseudobdellovibrionaceae bacterium]
MGANSFGHLFRITTFGESHGTALGAIIDGCPAGVNFDEDLLRRELARRRPGFWEGEASAPVSARQEADLPEVLSGVFEGRTLGTPIAIQVRNQDARSQDYAALKDNPRAGHADDTWAVKFGHRDHRGGGRSSGRETVARVMGGAVAKMLLQQIAPALRIRAYAEALGPHRLTDSEKLAFLKGTDAADRYAVRFPSPRAPTVVEDLKRIQAAHDSWGGIAEIVIQGAPAGLGQPVFHKLKSDLAMAMMSVGATSGFELGEGLHDAAQTGKSFHQDAASANYGGIRGGISTGDEIRFRVHFKPTSSILDVAKQGRHDPCIVIRALPVLESMTALVLADHALWSRLDRP